MSDTRCFGLVNYPEVKDAAKHAAVILGNMASAASAILDALDSMEHGETATLIIIRDDWLDKEAES